MLNHINPSGFTLVMYIYRGVFNNLYCSSLVFMYKKSISYNIIIHVFGQQYHRGTYNTIGKKLMVVCIFIAFWYYNNACLVRSYNCNSNNNIIMMVSL